MIRKSSRVTWFLVGLLTLALSASRAFATPIAIPVGTSYADGLLLTFGLPSGTDLDAGTEVRIEFEFEGLDAGEVLNIDLFHSVGGIHIPPTTIYEKVGGINIPIDALAGPLQTLELFIISMDIGDVNSGNGFEIALWLSAGAAADLLSFSATGIANAEEVTLITSPAIGAVPEPTTLALLGIAGLGFALRRRLH